MKVAVITPYYKESPEVLKRCMDSVANQTHADIIHVMVADGYPSDYVINRAEGNTKIMHIVIPNTNDGGSTPRGIGAAVIAQKECDAIAFLDADCWYDSDHIETALSVMTEHKPIVTIGRYLHRLDWSMLSLDPESDGLSFNDTSCYLIARSAFQSIWAWLFLDRKHGPVCDRVVWHYIPKQYTIRSPKSTVHFITRYAVHYLYYKEIPPNGCITLETDATGKTYAKPYKS
jgi:glycosyltransferase involved in cell wall biosynthesis